MQGCAPPHIARLVKTLLSVYFEDFRIIRKVFRLLGIISEIKSNIARYVAQIHRQTLHTTVKHAISYFEHVIYADSMNIEHVCEKMKFCVPN